MDSTHDLFTTLLDRRLSRRNARLWNHLLAWTDILDALGWCVALKTTAGIPHLSPNAANETTARANPASWDDVLAHLREIPPASHRVSSENFHVWLSTRPPASSLAHNSSLTPREAEVLAWLREGKTGPEIATILGCAQRTVESHVARLYRKLGFRNRTEVLLNSPPHG